MIQGILLAAGSARRFGSHKLLCHLPDTIPVGVASARHLLQGMGNAIAVVRPGDNELTDLLSAEGLDIFVAKQAVNGMGASIAAGIRASQHASGWIIALADMPWIKPDTIASIATMLERGVALAAPLYEGQRGHPVGFAQQFLPDLLGLTGDQGASDILRSNQHLLEYFRCDDAGTVKDIDQPQDLLSGHAMVVGTT